MVVVDAGDKPDGVILLKVNHGLNKLGKTEKIKIITIIGTI